MIEELDSGRDFEQQELSGDFKDYYEKYYPVIFRHAAYLTGDTQAAEDITQEAFVKLYKAPPQHTGIGPWLSRIATNLAFNHMRDEKIKRNKDQFIGGYAEDNVISIEEIAIKDYEVRLTRKVLNRLKPRDRLCLLLKFSGYKYGEISEIAGVPKSSVGQIIARSQEKFRQLYLKEVNGK